jgi:osmoprotectant transport system permease protein
MGAALLGLLIVGAGAAAWARGPGLLPLGLVLAALVVLLVATGLSATTLLAGRPPSARAMLGAGFWVAFGALGLLLVEEARSTGRRSSVVVAAVLVGAILLAGTLGAYDRLSLAVEWRARSGAIAIGLRQHLALSAAALGLALAVALPLGLAAFRWPRAEAAIGAGLNAVQVVPAIALFGFLIPVLAALLAWAPALRSLGIAAIGATPALIGVAVYVALPLTRGVASGLKAADPAAVEAARAMGMTDTQITREIRLPLGLPILAGALRVAAVQSIGLMTLGGLIGAGGLGAVVFEGMSQLAADLILLGALPIVALALIADAGLAGLEARLARRRR